MTETSSSAQGGRQAGSAPRANAAQPAFIPLLTTVDWNEEWKQLQKSRKAADDATYWDKRSATFTTKDAPNPYVERFLALASIQPGETVFDMGCGTGALTVPLAKAGHDVTAADFSAGMLEMLGDFLENAGERARRHVRIEQVSWSDDWGAHGIVPDSFDVALASRSIATADMRDSLLRLTDVARRRVCITLSTGSSPRSDDALLSELGIAGRAGRDFLYAFNILAAEGLHPEVSYISSIRDDTFDTREDALASFRRMVDSALRFPADGSASASEQAERDAAMTRLDAWLDANLVSNPHAGEPDRKGVAQGELKVTRPRTINWAFIAWGK
ncbi:MAG: methyltransferase domain-containing protein [Eggerthellaceae bacterium]|nr:methyltransferase domain-containing protein [Eggerthellaceae bacterium]